jgi:hypothetical protein
LGFLSDLKEKLELEKARKQELELIKEHARLAEKEKLDRIKELEDYEKKKESDERSIKKAEEAGREQARQEAEQKPGITGKTTKIFKQIAKAGKSINDGMEEGFKEFDAGMKEFDNTLNGIFGEPEKKKKSVRRKSKPKKETEILCIKLLKQ